MLRERVHTHGHNVSVLLNHYVCPAKYSRVIFGSEVDASLKEVSLEIGRRYEIAFVEIGTDHDHVHFLVQSVPALSPTRIIQIAKSITAKEIFKRNPEVKKKLWGCEFWTKGFYVNTVGRHGDERAIQKCVQEQGSERQYKKIHCQQLTLF